MPNRSHNQNQRPIEFETHAQVVHVGRADEGANANANANATSRAGVSACEITSASASVNADTANADAHLNRAARLIHDGRYRPALRMLTPLMEEAAMVTNVHYLIGQCHRMMNNYGDAIAHLKQSEQAALLEGNRHIDAVRNALGLALLSNGLCDEALRVFEKALATRNWIQKAAIFNSMGLAYKKMKRYPQALMMYRRAMKCLLVDARKKFERDSGQRAHRTRHNAAHYAHYLRRSIGYAMVANNIGMVYLATGRLAQAKAQFVEAIKFIPKGRDYPSPYRHLADIAAQEVAVRDAERLAERNGWATVTTVQ